MELYAWPLYGGKLDTLAGTLRGWVTPAPAVTGDYDGDSVWNLDEYRYGLNQRLADGNGKAGGQERSASGLHIGLFARDSLTQLFSVSQTQIV